jgi:rhodanese-related sulfurtransferase
LQAKGIPNVVKMHAGYQGWAAANLPIERNGK